MKDLSLNEIASRVADAVMEKSYVSKQELVERIVPILRIWWAKTTRPKVGRKGSNKVEVYKLTIAKKHEEIRLWREKFKKLVGEENMQPHYDEVNSTIEELGYE